ncbi:MAG: helix-turn-helix transcriptional regulator [Lachnospiraceae bacterium]|nr:helix-turn-helix transcriptional regulator [Lachnospiraceae bacterium]
MKKEKQRITLVGVLRNGGIFRQIFLSIMLLSLIMIVLVIFWINRIASSNYQSQSIRQEMNRLSAADRSLTQICDDLAANMTQFLWTRDVLNYTLRPENASDSNYYTIYRLLKNQVATNKMIKKAAYYSDVSGVVLQSLHSRILKLDTFDDAFVFQREEEGSRADYYDFSSDKGQAVDTTLVFYAGRIFLVADFNFGKYLASAMLELDVAELSRLISNEGAQSYDMIYPFDKYGVPVFGQTLSYQPIGSVMPQDGADITVITQPDVPILKLGKSYYCRVDGERLPWSYVTPLIAENYRISFRQSLLAWLPALMIMAFFALLLSWFVIRNIYDPVQRLLTLARRVPSADTTEGREKMNNEFTLLEDAYSEAVSQQQQMTRILDTVAPHVLETLLSQLLNGRSITRDRLKEILEGIGDPLPIDGRFMAVGCQIDEPADRMVTETEWNLYLLSLQNLISDYSKKDFQLEVIRLDRDTVGLLLAFPEGASVVRIRKEYHEIRRHLLGNAEVLPYRLWVEYGTIVSCLSEIGSSWKECAGRLKYSRYNSEKAVEPDSESVPEEINETHETEILDRHWYKEKIQKAVALVISGQRTGAHLLMEETLAEIESRFIPDVERIKQAYMILLDEMVEKLVQYPLTKEEQEMVEGKSVASRFAATNDVEAMHIYVLERCRQMGHMIYVYNQKSQFKYVEQAKEYIGDHYKDSNLSLSDVAEHIGISSSYLSELFVELGGDKFSAYLASFRVEKARQLLKITTMPAKDVGFQCGFNSVQNFNRVFKKYTGLTPGQYRDAQKN